MPTINYERTPEGVPFHDSGISLVKIVNRKATPYGVSRARTYNTVHIENEHDRPYGGQSLPYCGRLFEVGNYIFVNRWTATYRICRSCHENALRRNYRYREFVERYGPKQLELPQANS